MRRLSRSAPVGALWLVASGLPAGPAQAGVVYSNDFETNTDGFDIADASSLPIEAEAGTAAWPSVRTRSR